MSAAERFWHQVFIAALTGAFSSQENRFTEAKYLVDRTARLADEALKAARERKLIE